MATDFEENTELCGEHAHCRCMQYGDKIAEVFALLIAVAVLAVVFSLAGTLREPRLHATLTVLSAHPVAEPDKECDPVCLPYAVDVSEVGQFRRSPAEIASASATALR